MNRFLTRIIVLVALQGVLVSCSCSVAHSSNETTTTTTSNTSTSVRSSTSEPHIISSTETTLPPVTSTSTIEVGTYYTVTFLTYDGVTVIGHVRVKRGATAVYSGTIPDHPSTVQYYYVFTGWDQDLTNVTKDIETKAVYEARIQKYNINFRNYDETLLDWEYGIRYGETPYYAGKPPRNRMTSISPTPLKAGTMTSRWPIAMTLITRPIRARRNNVYGGDSSFND
jgi:hypothetical protein